MTSAPTCPACGGPLVDRGVVTVTWSELLAAGVIVPPGMVDGDYRHWRCPAGHDEQFVREPV